MSFWFWSRIKNIRRELLDGKNNSIFPIADKPNDNRDSTSNKDDNKGDRGDGDNIITSKSVSPSSLLSKSFTSADFVAKTLLDKKVFAASGQICKSSPSSGLKDLI